MELLIGSILRVGVVLAAVVTAAGGVMLLLRQGGTRVAFHEFTGEAAPFRSLGGIVRGAFAGESAAIVQLGLLLLIATPIARVALSMLAFLRQKDWTYVLLCAVVLAVLLYGFTGGGVG